MKKLENLLAIHSILKGNLNPQVLEKYSGFGGIGKELSEYNYYKKLNAIIAKSDIDKIKATTKTAYYTPEIIVKFIYDALSTLGFKGGNILEPAAGIGAFVKHMPSCIREKSKILTIDSDPLACRILKALYPDISVINRKFEDIEIQNNSLDLVIGNPPYGRFIVNDKNNPDLAKHAIHHYFAARGARLLKKNGILAFVINSYFMDNICDHVRDIIKKEGCSLLAAYRLPDNLFNNAKVTVDIIFIIKNKLNTKWQITNPITIGNKTKPINEYYINNQHNILGNLTIVPMYKRTGLTCKGDGDLEIKLQDRLRYLPENFHLRLKISHWLESILKKQWSEIIQECNYIRKLSNRHPLKFNPPIAKINYVTSDYVLKGAEFIEVPLEKAQCYCEILLCFQQKQKDFMHTLHMEIAIKGLLKPKIGTRLKYKLFFSYNK